MSHWHCLSVCLFHTQSHRSYHAWIFHYFFSLLFLHHRFSLPFRPAHHIPIEPLNRANYGFWREQRSNHYYCRVKTSHTDHNARLTMILAKVSQIVMSMSCSSILGKDKKCRFLKKIFRNVHNFADKKKKNWVSELLNWTWPFCKMYKIKAQSKSSPFHPFPFLIKPVPSARLRLCQLGKQIAN